MINGTWRPNGFDNAGAKYEVAPFPDKGRWSVCAVER